MKPPHLTTCKIKTLRRTLQDRRFAVPKLQRNFVWDANRAAKLLDSIYHQMPIGSLFLWEMDRKSANLIRQATGVLPTFNGAHPRISFVIDGQQRLSVIYQAFEGREVKNDKGRNVDFGRVCFVVTPDGERQDPRRIVYRKPVDRQYVPVRDVLCSDWKRRMPSKAQWFLARIRDCRERLLSYPVPLVVVRSATLDDIGEVFIRVNSQGMRISSADRAVALMGKLDVRAMAEELRHKVRENVFDLEGIDPILMGFNLVTEPLDVDGDPPKLEAMARRWSKRLERDGTDRGAFRKLWHNYQNAFASAVDYLHTRFPVHDASYLPSANMLATLAVFFYHHRGQPNGHQAAEIRKWFWATGIAERYSGRGYHKNIVEDARLFKALASGRRRKFQLKDRLEREFDIQGTEYSARSARTRTFFCLLAAKRPRYLEGGAPIPLDKALISPANAKHRHHIFPQAQLKNHFPARAYNSLCNICFLVCRDNSCVGMRVPRSYLSDFAQEGKRQFHAVMKSHLIPVGPDSGVWKAGVTGAFRTFRRQRLELICKELEKQAGMTLFRKHE